MKAIPLFSCLFVGGLVVFGTVACDDVPTPPAAAPEPALLPASVVTDGVAIAGYGTGKPDDTPFVIADKESKAPFEVACKALPLTPDDYKQALDNGAARVRVKVPQLDAPLYGVLALCRMPHAAKGPGSRAHRVQVPSNYVDATDGGRVSVVFEEVSTDGDAVTSWQLFLSRTGFAGDDASLADKAGKRAAEASEATGKSHVLPPPAADGADAASKDAPASAGPDAGASPEKQAAAAPSAPAPTPETPAPAPATPPSTAKKGHKK
jgi:hypothetical protein